MTQHPPQSDGDQAERPPSHADELGFAHELVHTLTATLFNLTRASEISSKTLADIYEYEWEDLRDYISTSRVDAEGQMFDALNVVSARWPELVGSLTRPKEVRESPSVILRDILPGYEINAHQLGITFKWKDDSTEIPPLDLEWYALRRAFHNLISNAVKYSYSSRRRKLRHVDLRSRHVGRSPDVWAITIENYGIGIEPGELVKIFEPGYRGRFARGENTFGAGLGLGEARRCMNNIGGSIKIHSDRVGEHLGDKHEQIFVTKVTMLFTRRHHGAG